ncbi:UNVERIFIED_ORG: DNA repair protein RadC [Arthrobacter sp. UYEF1]
MTDLPESERPRERLLRLGSGALSDAELVAILLGSGRPGVNVIGLAHAVLSEFGGVSGLLRVQVPDLTSVAGIGPAMASRFVSAAELCRRSATDRPPVRVHSSADLAPVAVAQLADLPHERLLMFGLSPAGSLRNPVILAEGSDAHASCPVSSVLRAALAGGFSKFALAHNHPSGVLEASHADIDYTSQVAAAARQCGLQLIDHLIVSGSRWKSVL